VQSNDFRQLRPGVWAHGPVGKNMDPESKIADFTRLLEGGIGARADIAFFKFCFVDIGPSTDVERLFGRYRDALHSLALAYPKISFVHLTVPLTVIQTGFKASMKTLFGRPLWSELANLRRAQFNARVRQHYAGQPVFDIASLEATAPDGRVHARAFQGHQVQFLAPIYAQGNGHLNPAGELHVGAALLRFLGDLAQRRVREAAGEGAAGAGTAVGPQPARERGTPADD
jgi:hypothetical protein